MRWWLADRYPFFKENFAGNAAELDQLIATCQTRGLHPVLLELPLNLPIVGHAFDKPRKTLSRQLPGSGQEVRHPEDRLPRARSTW